MKAKMISKLIVICMSFLMAISLEAYGGEVKEDNTDTANLTMEEIVQANSADALFQKYDNVLNQMDGEYICLSELYVSKDYCFENDYNKLQLVTPEDYWQYMDVNGENYLCYAWFAMDDDEKAEITLTPSDYANPIVSGDYTLLEEIQDITDNGDGTLTITTKLDSEYVAKRLKEDDMEYPEEYYSSDNEIVYIVDKNSLEIQSYTESLLTDSGKIPFISTQVTYNADYTEDMKNMISLSDEFINGEKTNPRTITIIYDYETDQEQTFSITIDPKFKVLPYIRAGYSLYNDPEKKEVYTGGDGVSDLTIYAFYEE